jgi:hypothetical protein
MGAGTALLRAGVVSGGRAEAEAISALAGAIWPFACAMYGRIRRQRDTEGD